MKKSRTDIRSTKEVLNIHKPKDLKELKKAITKLKTNVYKRLTYKHNSNKNTYITKVVDNLIFNKNTHMASEFRDCMMLDFTDEFLKR
jgi:hypothetical protein